MPHITILRDDRKEGLDLLSKYNMEELTENGKNLILNYLILEKRYGK